MAMWVVVVLAVGWAAGQTQNSWLETSVGPSMPGGRFAHSMVGLGEDSPLFLVLYGGATVRFSGGTFWEGLQNMSDELWMYSFLQQGWSLIHRRANVTWPPGLAGHSAFAVGATRVYVFGGAQTVNGMVLPANDLWLFQVDQMVIMIRLFVSSPFYLPFFAKRKKEKKERNRKEEKKRGERVCFGGFWVWGRECLVGAFASSSSFFF